MDDKVVIKGKEFERKYVEEVGKKHLMRNANIFKKYGRICLIIGASLTVLLIILLIIGAVVESYGLITVSGSLMAISIVILLASAGLLIAYKVRSGRDPFPYGVKILEREARYSSSTSGDKFEEIKKYKELLDKGIISNEEFEAKKKELLG
jgi:hypothetical protein